MDDRFYKKETLIKVFGFLAVAMLVASLWMILDDFGREWKGYQREFTVLKKKKLDKAVEDAKAAIDAGSLKKAQEELVSAEGVIKGHQKDVDDADKAIDELKTKEKIATGKYQDAKAIWDVQKYHYEADYGHNVAEGHGDHLGKKAEKALTRLEDNWKKVLEVRNQASVLQMELIDAQKKRAGLIAARTDAEKHLKLVRTELDKQELARDAEKFTLTKLIRSSPIIDLASPVFRLQQIVLPGIRDDFYFASVQRVDRCTTCHLAIDTPGFEGEANPFKTHPKLDLMLGSRSPHPLDTIGCTACHEGRGQATHFVRSAHTPQNEDQKRVWEKKYGWREMHHVMEKMIPLQYTEGKCRTCHKQTEYVPRAQKLDRGVQMVKSAGCYGCHRIEGWDHVRKPAPSLKRVKGKLTREWILKWIRSPKSFNNHARMPAAFHQANITTDEYKAYNDAEIVALGDYLMELSEDYAPNHPLALGSVEKGKELVASIGCLGCHQIDDFGQTRGRFGQAPDLSMVGSKVSRDWLTSWLKDPRHYWAATVMPSLRLTDPEISDIAAYLMSKRNSEFEGTAAPATTEETQRKVLRLYVQRDPKFAPATDEKVDKYIGTLDAHNLSLELGKNSVMRYGCFGCHEIKGLEKTPGIGVELTEEGTKPVNKLDFGLLHFEHTNFAWFDKKLENTRIFDSGQVKEYLDLLRMPNYEFDEPERGSLITFLLGQTAQKILPPAAKVLNAREAKMEEGLRVVHKYNCQGCHIVEGMFESLADEAPAREEHEKLKRLLEGRILVHYEEDDSLGPPPLVTEGRRVHPDWVYPFLQDPGRTPLRTKLKVRMPSFQMPNEEYNQIVSYWAHYSGDAEYPYRQPKAVELSPTEMEAAKTLFTKLQCLNCHTVNRNPTPEEMEGGSKGLAPDFIHASKRLRKEWVVALLQDPNKMIPGTRMPGFWPDGQSPVPDVLGGDSKRQIEAVAKYVLWLGQGHN
ncbi:MAG: c-type cytochrome [Deltaproteobacteria bacterium]|nr:c-type cytochrome [Deltaproteobacteria bacterium]MBI3294383.1 c-type cytochrome [Deltaproteobacteria bacterium]